MLQGEYRFSLSSVEKRLTRDRRYEFSKSTSESYGKQIYFTKEVVCKIP